VSGALTAATWGGATSFATPATAPSRAALNCDCYSPHQFDVAYGIQPLLESGTDGRDETVTVLVAAPQPNWGPAGSGPAPGTVGTDIRQDVKGFDSMFRLPVPRIEVVTSLAGSASPWQATLEEVGDTEIVHAVAPAATLRVVLVPSSWSQSASKATADLVAGLRLAVSHTDVASISAALGEHYFTKAQVAKMHSILLGAEAHHVTVVVSSGDTDWHSDNIWGGH
jgi:subtilase family serine protease